MVGRGTLRHSCSVGVAPMSETVTVELTEEQLGWLDDALRWQIETAEENGYTRNERKMRKVRQAINDQVGDTDE